jgi:hypothetical protein
LLDPGIPSGRRHTDSPTDSACDSTASVYAGPACADAETKARPACGDAETKARPDRDSGTDRHPCRDGDTEPCANRHPTAHANGRERASERGTITVRGVGAEPAGLAVEFSHAGSCQQRGDPGPVER